MSTKTTNPAKTFTQIAAAVLLSASASFAQAATYTMTMESWGAQQQEGLMKGSQAQHDHSLWGSSGSTAITISQSDKPDASILAEYKNYGESEGWDTQKYSLGYSQDQAYGISLTKSCGKIDCIEDPPAVPLPPAFYHFLSGALLIGGLAYGSRRSRTKTSERGMAFGG